MNYFLKTNKNFLTYSLIILIVIPFFGINFFISLLGNILLLLFLIPLLLVILVFIGFNSYKSKIADAESEDYAYQNFKNVLTTNISKAYLNLKLNEEKIISSLKEIESSRESVRLSRLRYDVGISTLKDVLVRQSELSNAKSKNINAIYNYNLNIDELERLTFLDISKNCLDSNNTKIKDTESICNIKI